MSDTLAADAPTTLARPTAPALQLPSLADAAPWLARFTPPFAFGDFFAPEDTVLCALAMRAALAAAPRARRVVEMTAGSAVVLADALCTDRRLRGAATEVDADAVRRARANLAGLGLAARGHVVRAGLFGRRSARWLRTFAPDVVACNPPYIPVPPGDALALVAGAGADGARHPRRAIHVAARAGVPRLVLSWCSLGNPIDVVRAAARAGYVLARLWTVVLADGEYSGAVHDYLRTLPTAYLHEGASTLQALAPDGAARFAYLLLAGEFVRGDDHGPAGDRGRQTARDSARRGADVVGALVHAFARDGAVAVEQRAGADGRSVLDGVACHWFACDRWDELRLRALAHGAAAAATQ